MRIAAKARRKSIALREGMECVADAKSIMLAVFVYVCSAGIDQCMFRKWKWKEGGWDEVRKIWTAGVYRYRSEGVKNCWVALIHFGGWEQ